MPDGKVIAPTGKSFDLDFATTAKWEGDLLLEEFVFVDPLSGRSRLGSPSLGEAVHVALSAAKPKARYAPRLVGSAEVIARAKTGALSLVIAVCRDQKIKTPGWDIGSTQD